MLLLLTQPPSALPSSRVHSPCCPFHCPLPATPPPLPSLFRVLQIESKNWLLLYMSPDNGHNSLYAPRSAQPATPSNFERAGVDVTMGGRYFDESEEVEGGESKQSSSKGTCFCVWGGVVNAIDM